MKHITVRDWVLSPALTIRPNESLRRARALMGAARVTELLVVDDGKVVGSLSEHDLLYKCPTGILLLDDDKADELLEQVRVGGVMALYPPTVSPDTLVSEAAELLAASGHRVLAVVDNGVLLGTLTENRFIQSLATLLSQEEDRTSNREA